MLVLFLINLLRPEIVINWMSECDVKFVYNYWQSMFPIWFFFSIIFIIFKC